MFIKVTIQASTVMQSLPIAIIEKGYVTGMSVDFESGSQSE